jgi:RNA polymerase sigma factor (sigma-70 family)
MKPVNLNDSEIAKIIGNASNRFPYGEHDDWFQTAFLHVWKRLSIFDPERGTFSTWVNAVVRQLRHDKIRVSYNRPKTVAPNMEFVADNFDVVSIIDAVVDVQTAMVCLIPADREIMEKIMEGKSITDCANELQISRQAVSQKSIRAMAKMKRFLRRSINLVTKDLEQ